VTSGPLSRQRTRTPKGIKVVTRGEVLKRPIFRADVLALGKSLLKIRQKLISE